MDLRKSDRATLKGYFVKNAVPTAGNFAELIDGLVNQKEDGIAKVAGEPLSLQAEGAAAGPQKALNFYKNFAQDKPDWALSLNPGRPGWSVDGADGKSRLFIDEATGNLGVGTVDPGGAKLTVAGSFKAAANASGERPIAMEPPKDANHRGSGTQAATGLVYRITAGNPAAGEPIFQVRSEGQAVRFFVEHDGWTGSRDNSAWFGGAKINYFNGNVGIGAFAPLGKLEVFGAAAISSGSRHAIEKNLAPGALSVGGTDRSYGGGTAQWNTNTAALLLETAANTEIAVNDAGHRLASLLYYEGDTVNRITIGRNMGFDAIKEVVVNGTVRMPGTLKAKSVRVTHYTARVSSKIDLGAGSWADVSQLTVKVILAQDAEVNVFYGVAAQCSSAAGFLCTRLLRNGVEEPAARAITGNTVYWSSSSTWAASLSAGTYEFRVQYRSSGGGALDPASDWQKGVLTATVYGAD